MVLLLVLICTLSKSAIHKGPALIDDIEIDVRMVVLVFGRLPRNRPYLDAIVEDGHLVRGRVRAEH